jgi:hypothetical protein
MVVGSSFELEVVDDGRKEENRSFIYGRYFSQRSLPELPLMLAGRGAIHPDRTHSGSARLVE